MAHKKGEGSVKNGRDSQSKRLGVKIFGGQAAVSGHITVGEGTKIGPKSGVMSAVKPNSVLLGAPALDFKLAMKTFSIIRNLPELRNDVIELQKKVKIIEDNK